MQPMIDFTTWVLTALADFLGTPPIFYLFGLILLCIVCRAIQILIGRH